MDNAGRIRRPKRAPDAVAVFKSGANMHTFPARDKDSRQDFPRPYLQQIGANRLEKQALQVGPDSAILRRGRTLARQAAREDIEIRAVHEGVVNTALIGLRGLVGRLCREDNAHKVRRGQAGRIGRGLNAGGRTYGYEPVPGDPGKRMVIEAEAEIVRRIFRDYVAGRTPRDIAHELNAERVTPPRGRAWNASTINGNMLRGNGILNNELYAGRLVWNKVRMMKDPDTGK